MCCVLLCCAVLMCFMVIITFIFNKCCVRTNKAKRYHYSHYNEHEASHQAITSSRAKAFIQHDLVLRGMGLSETCHHHQRTSEVTTWRGRDHQTIARTYNHHQRTCSAILSQTPKWDHNSVYPQLTSCRWRPVLVQPNTLRSRSAKQTHIRWSPLRCIRWEAWVWRVTSHREPSGED